MRIKTLNQSAGVSACVGLALAAMACAISPLAKAQLPEASGDYIIQVVEPPPYTTAIWWLFMNDSGLLDMDYFVSPPTGVSQGHSAVLENGEWKVLDVPGSQWTGLTDPSASGRIGLVYADSAGNWHNEIYHRGTTYPVPDYVPLPGQPAWQYGIQLMSDHGVMTGVAFDPNKDIDPDGSIHYHGLLLNETLSLFQIFDLPGSQYTLPLGICNAGIVVGYYLKWTGPGPWDGTDRGFLSQQGQTFADLDPPGCVNSTAVCINNSGEICGCYSDDPTNPNMWAGHGYLLRLGKFSAFNVPKSSWTNLCWITDNGKLAGVCADANGNQFGFIATPKHGGK